MTTSAGRLLAAIVLDSKLNLRFVRTGDAAEGARVALANVSALLERGNRHWRITLRWGPGDMSVDVRA